MWLMVIWMFLLNQRNLITIVESYFGDRNVHSHPNEVGVKNSGKMIFVCVCVCVLWKPMFLGLWKWASTHLPGLGCLLSLKFSMCCIVPAASSLAWVLFVDNTHTVFMCMKGVFTQSTKHLILYHLHSLCQNVLKTVFNAFSPLPLFKFF